MNSIQSRCGYVSIVGRPNVGKSTLLNALLDKKMSITSRKPQTTRYRMLGIKTLSDTQTIYIDTPGLHQRTHRLADRYMNRAALSSLSGVDILMVVVEPWSHEGDAWVLKQIKSTKATVFLVINKIDLLKDRSQLLPYIKNMLDMFHFSEIIPISAERQIQLKDLEKTIIRYLPPSPFLFPETQLTDKNDQFIASEIIREKLMRLLGQELPYALAVTIIAFAQEPQILRISAVIWVERDSQKPILIGKGGGKLKAVGIKARIDLERFFEKKVFLHLWVKVKKDWLDNEKLLTSLGLNT